MTRFLTGNGKLIVAALAFAFTALAAEPTPSASVPSKPKTDSRLSWAPRTFLQKGMRNVPWVNDPFFPETKSLHLSGIVSNEMAFINGKWYRLGDEVEGYRLKSITADGVTVARNSEVLVIKIGE